MSELRQPAEIPEPMISVVIPTRNRRDALERCRAALAEQAFEDFEIIIVDDSSTDGTADFVNDFATDHATMRLRCIVNTTHLGANGSRNRGIREAQGSLIAFLDSDCIAAPDWLEQLVRGFDEDRVAAVTGLVEDPAATNIFELTYRGTNRVRAAGYPTRLVGGNMAVRRNLLLQYPLDEDLKYGCDEEGLYLRLRAAGHDQRFLFGARVRHEHPFTARSFFRQARLGGAAAAWLIYKYHRPPRLDLMPFILFYLSLPLGLVSTGLLTISAIFGAGALAALSYNELYRKGKTITETVRVFPVLLAYYHVRLVAYVTETILLRIRKHGIKRVRLPGG